MQSKLTSLNISHRCSIIGQILGVPILEGLELVHLNNHDVPQSTDKNAEFAKKVSYYGVSLAEYAETLKKDEIQLVYNNWLTVINIHCNTTRITYVYM